MFEEFLRGHRSSMQSNRASELANLAREAELAGNVQRRDELLGKAQQHLQRAQEIGPSVRSYTEVDSVENAVRYALGLTGESALSVTASIAGGAAGRALTGASTRLVPGVARTLSKTPKLREAVDATGTFAGATVPLYPSIKGGIILGQEADPTIRQQSVQERERAAQLTALGSTALEAAVPAAIGARVGRRALARNRFTAAELQGRVSGKGRLASDMLAEGMTEISQQNLEQFALHLQNPEQARFASTEEGLNAFFGGMAGGAFGHGVGRAMEAGVDFGSRIEPQGPGTFGMFGNVRLRPKPRILASLLTGDETTADTIQTIDVINRQLFQNGVFGPDSKLNAKERAAALNEAIDRNVSSKDKPFVYALTRYTHALESGQDYQNARKELVGEWARKINPGRPQMKLAEEKVVQLETQLEQSEEQLNNMLKGVFSETDDPVGYIEKTLDKMGPVTDESGEFLPFEFDNLKVIDASDPFMAREMNPDEYHFVFASPESGRTARHSPLRLNEAQTIARPAYVAKEDPFEVRNLMRNLYKSPYTNRYQTVSTSLQDLDALNQPPEITSDFDVDRVEIVPYSVFINSANQSSTRDMQQIDPQQAFMYAAQYLIADLQQRIRENTDAQPNVLDQHAQQIQELQSALALEEEWRQSNPGTGLMPRGAYDADGNRTPSLKNLFDTKYVVGAVRRQEVADQQEPGLQATRRELSMMQRGLKTGGKTKEEAQDERQAMLERRIAVLQRLSPAEREQEGAVPYRIIYVDPKSVGQVAASNWRLRQEDKPGQTPSMHKFISEGLSSILNMPETVGFVETDAEGNPIMGDPNLLNAQQLDQDRYAIPDVLIKSGSKNKAPEIGTVAVTRILPSRKISQRASEFEGYYSGTLAESQKYWEEQREKLETTDSNVYNMFKVQFVKDLIELAQASGLEALTNMAQNAAEALALNVETEIYNANESNTADTQTPSEFARTGMLQGPLKQLGLDLHKALDQSMDPFTATDEEGNSLARWTPEIYQNLRSLLAGEENALDMLQDIELGKGPSVEAIQDFQKRRAPKLLAEVQKLQAAREFLKQKDLELLSLKESGEFEGVDATAIKLRRRMLKTLDRALRDIYGSLDEKLMAINAEESSYVLAGMDEITDPDLKELKLRQQGYQPEQQGNRYPAPNDITATLADGTEVSLLPQEPRLPMPDDAKIRGMQRATEKVVRLMRGWTAKQWNKRLSKIEQQLMHRAFALITDQQGARGLNVGKYLSNVTANQAVYAALNALPTGRAASQLETVMGNQAVVVLSSGSQVNKAQFTEWMQERGYLPHTTYSNVFLTAHPLKAFRGNEGWAAEVEAYNKLRQDFTQKLAAGQEFEADWMFVRELLWRSNFWYTGPIAFQRKTAAQPFMLTPYERDRLKAMGYEMTREGSQVLLRPVAAAVKEKQVSDAEENQASLNKTRRKKGKSAKSETQQQDDNLERKYRKEKRENKFYQQTSDAFAGVQTAIEAGLEAVTDWQSANARAAVARFFSEFTISDNEQRMHRDLDKSLWRNKRVRRQIENHMQNDALLKQLDVNPKELDRIAAGDKNLYYALAFQLSTMTDAKGKPLINLSPTAEQWFKRIIEALFELVGIHLSHYYGEQVFTWIKGVQLENSDTGKDVLYQLRRREDIDTFYSKTSSKADQALADISIEVNRAVDRTVRAAPDVLRNLGTPSALRLAKAFDEFLPRRRWQNDAWLNKLKRNLLDSFSGDELTEGWQQYRIGQPKSKAAIAMADYVDEVYRYMERYKVRLSNFDGKEFKTASPMERNWRVPAAFSIEAIGKDRAAFETLFVKHGLELDQAVKLTDSILWAGGHYSLVDYHNGVSYDYDSNPTAPGTLSGLFQIINDGNAREFEPFMAEDGVAALLKFTRQAVHRTEFTKAFEHNGAMIDRTLMDLRARKLNPSKLKYIEDRVIPSMVGTLTYKMSPKWREAMGLVVTVQNMAVLPLMLFAAMVDIWGISMKTGDMGDAWYAFKRGLREIRASIAQEGPGAQEDMADLLGIITEQSLLDRVGDTYNEMLAENSLLRKMNQKFFMLTGIEQWTKGIRIAALQAGVKYIVKQQELAKSPDAKVQESAKNALKELGLKPDQIKLDKDGSLLIRDSKSEAYNDRMASALNRFVDSTVLRPSAAHRPAWGSDPRWLLVWHLKQFTFTFQKVFLENVVREMQKTNPNYFVLLPFLMMVPTMMVSDAVKNIIFPSAYYEKMSFGETISHAVARSSILGVGTFGLDAMTDIEFGKIPGSSLLGPTADSAYRFYDRGLAEGLFRLTPGYAIWNRWF